MPSSSALAIDRARSWQRNCVQLAVSSFQTKGIGIPRMMSGGFPNYLELAYGQTLMRHAEQYTHFTGWTYVVISRIATRLAGQKVKMGRKTESPSVTSWNWDRTPGKRLSILDKMRAPNYVKNLDMDMEMIEDHPLLKAIQRPNNVMTNWSLIYITIASMELTGKAYWWFIEEDDGSLSIWPLPSDWVTPVHSDNHLFERYRIHPGGQSGVSEIVDGKDIAYFCLPDPSNPVGAVSPLQSQAPAIAIDEEIQSSQYRFFKNGIFPGMKITTGRLPSMTGTGEGPRPILTSDQRREIREVARALWQSSTNFNEPFIVDGLIEDIQRISQTGEEMSFIESATFNKSRIFQAFGCNPYIVGEVTGVNKAQAVVAESNFNMNVLSPLASMIGEKMSAHIGEDDVFFWLELPETNDPDQKLRNWQAAMPLQIVTVNEVRRELLQLPPLGTERDDELVGNAGGGGFGGGFGGGAPQQGNGGKPGDTQSGMKKLDEIELYAKLRHSRLPNIDAVESFAFEIGISAKRCFDLLEKWADKGWWEYDVFLCGGWFTPEAPDLIA